MKVNRQKHLLQICGNDQVNYSGDLRNYITQIIGFFLISKEIELKFGIKFDIEEIWQEVSNKIEKKINYVVTKLKNTEEFFIIRNELYLLSFVLQKLNNKFLSKSIIIFLKKIFNDYAFKMIDYSKNILVEKIINDSFKNMVVNNREDFDYYFNVFNLGNNVNFVKNFEKQKKKVITNKYENVILPFSEILSEVGNKNNYNMNLFIKKIKKLNFKQLK